MINRIVPNTVVSMKALILFKLDKRMITVHPLAHYSQPLVSSDDFHVETSAFQNREDHRKQLLHVVNSGDHLPTE